MTLRDDTAGARPRTHLQDAVFHLTNAVRSLERAVDAAPDGRRYRDWQQAAALGRRLVRFCRAAERQRVVR